MPEKSAADKRQIISIAICWLAVACMYPGRNGFAANITLIEEDYAVSHAQAGLVMTMFFAAYGVTQVIHGFFCKRYNKKIVVPAALAASAVINLILVFGPPFGIIKYLWLLNAACQSLVWPCALQVISENVSEKYMNRAMFFISVTTAVGMLATYGIGAAFAAANSYRLTFLFGAALLLTVAVIWFFCYRKGDCLENSAPAGQTPENKGKRIYLYLPVALFFFFSVIMFFTRDGLQSFAPAILKDMHGMSDSVSIWLTMILPFVGAFGAVFGIFLNKHVKKLIILEILLFVLLAALDTVLIFYGERLLVMLITFAAIGLLSSSAICVITTVFPLSMRGSMSSGALTGILNGGAYLGSAISAYIIGRVADISGWNAVFAVLAVTVASAAAAGGIYWVACSRKKELRV